MFEGPYQAGLQVGPKVALNPTAEDLSSLLAPASVLSGSLSWRRE